MMKRLLTLLLLLLSYYSFSQANINMPLGTNGGNGFRFIGCGSTAFNDNGGNSSYGNNEANISVLCPAIDTDRMQLNFLQVDLLAGDVLTIFDGDSTAAPVLGTVTNTTSPAGLFEASPTNTTGCLTVRFVSNGSGTAGGWRALRSCFDPCQTITTDITTTPATSPDGVLRICQGDTVTFEGSANFSVDGTGATYEWDLANGGGLNAGQVQSETYTDAGIYQTKFVVRDANGCSDREEIDLIVQVSTDPDFGGTVAGDSQICFGESTTLTGIVNTQEFSIPVSPPITGTTFLPDGSGVSYTTCIDVDLFAPGALVTNASDIVDIFVNMEHSYLGDLQLNIVAPNGSSVDLHSSGGGGGTYLGVPIDDDSNLDPGVGFDYVFTETATETWLQNSFGNATIPAGDYLPVDPFLSFIGSPLNGQWCITITDNLGSDNGFIFFWGLNFNPAIIPSELSFTPTVVSEEWQASPDFTNTTGNTVTITPTAAGQNCYTYEMTDNHGCTYTEQICVDVLPEIQSASPNDIIECNTTGATTTADLTVNDAVVLNGLSATDHIITYHTSQSDAENGIDAITNATAFSITTPPLTVFSAITNTITNCIVVDDFVVDIVDLTTLTIPDFEQCGPISNFDIPVYVGPFLSSGGSGSTNFTITYYTSLLDAQNETNPIVNPNMYDLVSGTVTIYVRVVSNTDPGCNTINSFTLTAATIPIANSPSNMVVCDDLTNDGVDTFILENQSASILNGQAATVTYHLTQADAIDGVAPLDATGYENVSNPQTIFVRVTDSTPLACSETTSFDLIVDRRAVFTVANDMDVCDDVTNDGIATFDLTSQDVDILGAQIANENSIRYFTNQADATAGISGTEIANPATYSNAIIGGETIFVRIENNTATDCADFGSFELVVNQLPVANPVADVIVCDDLGNDGMDVFNFDTYTSDVLLLQDPLLFNVSYHETPADASSGSNPLPTNGYTNISNPQTIYVRVENTNNDTCQDVTTTFDLIINRRAVFTVANNMIVCDDVTNDGIATFDLTSQDADILGAQVALDNTVRYFTTQADATAGVAGTEIANPATYSNAIIGGETIFVRIENNAATDCADFGSFELVVNQLPVANPVADVIVCDDVSNDGLDNFIFDDYTAQVLLSQDPLLFNVSYHESAADAASGSNPLPTNGYTNISNPQTIYVRIENTINDTCQDATTTFDLIINDSPRITDAPDLTLCDDPSGDGIELFDLTQNEVIILDGLNAADYTITYSNSSGVITSPYSNNASPETITVTVQNILTTCSVTTDFDLIVSPVPNVVPSFTVEECDEDGDGVASFTFADVTSQIINGQTGITATYYDSQANALAGLNALDNSSYNNTSTSQTIFYRLEFTNSGCFSLGDFIIEPVDAPIVVIPTALEGCDDGSGNATVNVSDANAQVTAGQAGSIVVYYLNQSDADSQSNGITSDFTYSANTTLIVRVDDENTDCFSFTTLDLIFNPLPSPTLLDQYVLCRDENGNLVNGAVTLDTGLNNVDFSFEWTLDGTPIAASTAVIDVVDGGDYEVTVTRISTGCVNVETTNVRVSSVPDVFDIDITTDPFDKDHQVIVTAEGPDQYWFRLDDGPYVNNGTFNDVSPGPHTVTIAERSGCGEIVIDIFVFGYPDYFTPNADGIHDTWNIIGGELLPGTNLYIFDRYGKLIKQLSVDGEGWDGTFNGQPMPSSDYWFKIEYTFDGEQREASGHFAMKR